MIKDLALFSFLAILVVFTLSFISYYDGDITDVWNSRTVRNIKIYKTNEKWLGVPVEVMEDEVSSKESIDLMPDSHSPINVENIHQSTYQNEYQNTYRKEYQNEYEEYIPVEDQTTEFIEDEIESPHMTIEERQKFQQTQVEKFCRLHGHKPDSKHLGNLDRHMLLHNRTKTAFCFAPKVGCTNLKILFFLSQGAISSSLLFKGDEHVENDILEGAIKKHSFHGLSLLTRHKILQTYYKFIMYRNPVERLLSAYRSKVEIEPLQGFARMHPQYNWLKRSIFRYKHSSAYKKWAANLGMAKISISFSDFVDYWLTGGLKHDEHFQTIFTLCQPCHVRYDYYGNFDTLEHDAEVLIKHIKSDSVFLRDSYYKDGEQTSVTAPEYYSQLSTKQKKMIIIKLARDLSFYYTIFPSQKDSHKSIMGSNFDIPPFY